MKRKLVFVTNNAHKLEEVRDIIKDKVELLSLKDIACFDEIEETGHTLTENALIKARYIKQKFGYDCFADDTGLEVDALNGVPGVYSARYAGEEQNPQKNIEKLLKELTGIGNRDACFRTVIALILDGEEYFFEGKIDGRILTEREGNGGFGYDPVFEPIGYSKSFASLGIEIKNKISHRALAVEALCSFLQSL